MSQEVEDSVRHGRRVCPVLPDHEGRAEAAAEAEAAAKGVELIWQGDSKEYSPATQIPVVDQVLALA